MAIITRGLLLYSQLLIFLLGSLANNGYAMRGIPLSAYSDIDRSSFPDGFLFGTASSAYQYEGAVNEDGRGPSIWDTFTERHPEKIKDHSTGAMATDSYHRYKEDVAIMKDIGLDAYRFSISWSRLLPRGRLSDGVNQEGINYYNNLIDELLSKGIQPFVTLFHWDLPQALEDEYDGFLSSRIVDDFSDYAELCFSKFGDRVKHWITLNEPYSYSNNGYATGAFAPGRCSKWLNCSEGDSSTEPYIVSHNMLLAHAAAVKVYRDKYQMSQKGHIGITLYSSWMIPATKSPADRLAAFRAIAFMYDWYMEPLNSGQYPVEMINYVKERLPQFTEDQSLMVKGSFDFIGINYYTTYYASDVPCKTENPSYATDSCVNTTGEENGIPIGQQAGSDWLYVYPRGIEDLLLYTKYKFNDPVIYITENGYSDFDTRFILLDDAARVHYYRGHFSFLERTIRIGANVKGFFAWSLLDNFEWNDGYSIRFGIIYIDYKNGLRRIPKKSALWFKNFLKGGNQLKQSI